MNFKLISLVCSYLKLNGAECSIQINYRNKPHKLGHAANCCLNSKGVISIKIFMRELCESEYNIDAIMVHELIHAWQSIYKPKGLKKKHHNRDFRKMVNKIHKMLTKRGYRIPKDQLYDKHLDVT